MRSSVAVVIRCSGAKSTKVPGGAAAPISISVAATWAFIPSRSTASGTARSSVAPGGGVSVSVTGWPSTADRNLVDAGIGAGHGLPVGQRDPGGVVQGLGGQGEHVPPQPRVLRARHLAGLPADHGQAPVPGQSAAAHLGRVQLLAQHGLDRVPAQYGHGS